MHIYIYIWISKLVNYDGSPAKIQKNTVHFWIGFHWFPPSLQHNFGCFFACFFCRVSPISASSLLWKSTGINQKCRNLLEDGQKNILVPIRKKIHAGKQAWQWNNYCSLQDGFLEQKHLECVFPCFNSPQHAMWNAHHAILSQPGAFQLPCPSHLAL